MKRWIMMSLLCVLPFMAQAGSDAYVTPYGALLNAHVVAGEKQGIPTMLVNYKAWAADGRHADAVSKLRASEPKAWRGNAAKAFWINAYNLLTIDLIIQKNERDSIKKIGGTFGNPWKETHWTIGGADYTLDAIEHKILRPMGDPRIHAAINCASLSCPDLRAEPYLAATLDAQLDDQMRIFLRSEKKGLRRDGNALTVSKIFDWFEKDFKPSGGVVAFIQRYQPEIAADATINDYLDYNWNLNGTW